MMVLAAAGAMPAYAATINVNTTDDVIDAADGKCSLREAVIAANTNDVSGAVAGECAAGEAAWVGEVPGVVDVIVVPASVVPYTLTLDGSDEVGVDGVDGGLPTVEVTPDPTKGDLDITESVTIMGAGSGATTIQWGVQDIRDRIFHVYATSGTIDVSIQGVALKNGKTVQECTFSVGDKTYCLRRAGGAIAVGLAARMVDPTVSGKDTAGGGGSRKPENPGEEEAGADYTLKLTDVVVEQNEAAGDGGGIYNGAPMTATNVVVRDNMALTNGGGIYNEGDTTISDSTISDNIAEGGGGLFLTGARPITIKGSTISGNRAVGGGALSGRSGVLVNVVNSTLSGNLARDVGAGFYHNGPATLNYVTIANNISGADAPSAGSGINTFQSGSVLILVKNTLVAANKKGWPSDVAEGEEVDPELYKTADIPQPGDDEFLALQNSNCGATGSGSPAIQSNGYNLSSDDTCIAVLNQATDINPLVGATIDPLIGPLADNNDGTTGTTFTHALLPGSPALGMGGADAITVDQRGVTRQSPPDIGAFELVTTSAGDDDGGGCTIGGNGRFDPTLPAMLAAALALFGWRRRAGK
jgi:CSLREA domain-containing protein